MITGKRRWSPIVPDVAQTGRLKLAFSAFWPAGLNTNLLQQLMPTIGDRFGKAVKSGYRLVKMFSENK